jgi:hypothetical protein
VQVRLALPERVPVEVQVYNVRGELVGSLRALPEPGFQALEWDARDARGVAAPNGVYFLRVRIGGDFERTLRAVLMR